MASLFQNIVIGSGRVAAEDRKERLAREKEERNFERQMQILTEQADRADARAAQAFEEKKSLLGLQQQFTKQQAERQTEIARKQEQIRTAAGMISEAAKIAASGGTNASQAVQGLATVLQPMLNLPHVAAFFGTNDANIIAQRMAADPATVIEQVNAALRDVSTQESQELLGQVAEGVSTGEKKFLDAYNQMSPQKKEEFARAFEEDPGFFGGLYNAFSNLEESAATSFAELVLGEKTVKERAGRTRAAKAEDTGLPADNPFLQDYQRTGNVTFLKLAEQAAALQEQNKMRVINPAPVAPVAPPVAPVAPVQTATPNAPIELDASNAPPPQAAVQPPPTQGIGGAVGIPPIDLNQMLA